MDDTSEPIVSMFFYALDLIIFLGMMSGVIMMMSIGNQVNDNAKHAMGNRDIITAQVASGGEQQKRYLTEEHGSEAAASRVGLNSNTSRAYDGLLTGEEVVNAILAMQYYEDSVRIRSGEQERRGSAYYDSATGEICPVVVINNGSRKNLGETEVPVPRQNHQTGASTNIKMSLIQYAQEVDVGKLLSEVDTDPKYLYRRTYTLADGQSFGTDEKAMARQVTYTRMER